MKLRILAILAAFTLTLAAAQHLLTPKYVGDVPEGAFIAEYYRADADNSVIVLGSSKAYSAINPVAMFNSHGVTSYVRAAPEQRIWQSLYVLEDTLKRETPQVVVLDILEMYNGEYSSEAYNRLNLEGLRDPLVKAYAALESGAELSDVPGYFFPILRYHDRWKSLTADDVAHFFSHPGATFNGYFMNCSVRPVTVVPNPRKLPDYGFPYRCVEYLDKIRELCDANGVTLVLTLTPFVYPIWYDEWETQIDDYAERYGLLYLNMQAAIDEIGIDYSRDTSDGGLHMNLTGSEKCSVWLAERLVKAYALPDLREDEDSAASRAALTARYEALRRIQTREFEETGAVITFTHRELL